MAQRANLLPLTQAEVQHVPLDVPAVLVYRRRGHELYGEAVYDHVVDGA